jgi:hypothetical protein
MGQYPMEKQETFSNYTGNIGSKPGRKTDLSEKKLSLVEKIRFRI